MTDQSLQQPASQEGGLRRFLLEIGPVALFFIVNKFYDRWMGVSEEIAAQNNDALIAATAVLIGATLISLVISWVVEKRVPIAGVLTAVLVSLFGGMTIYFDDELFIKLKPTIVNLLFAAILFGGLLFKKSLLKMLMGQALQLTEKAWFTLTWRWAVFFIFLAGVNEVVWRNFSTDFWVGFKLWGMTPLSFLFMMTQLPLILKNQIETTEPVSKD